MGLDEEIKLPWWQKYTLSIEEAAQYFGIGQKTLRRFIDEHKDADFLIRNGSQTLIKRVVFEKYVDEKLTVL
jgi:excisionase family DNA binding protein